LMGTSPLCFPLLLLYSHCKYFIIKLT
jgi:hypothetical protein